MANSHVDSAADVLVTLARAASPQKSGHRKSICNARWPVVDRRAVVACGEVVVETWLIVVLVVAGVVLIGFLAGAFRRFVVRSDGQSAEVEVVAPTRRRGRLRAKNTKGTRAKFKVRGGEVDLEDSDFTDSDTDVK